MYLKIRFVVFATGLIYAALLLFLLLRAPLLDDVRRSLSRLDQQLGVPIPEKTYASNCKFDLENVWSQCDSFVICHTVGWYVKALILRDRWILWIISVAFELCEYSLQHHLPNFAECWWDHWLLDVLICNAIGIYFGLKTCHRYQIPLFDWRGTNATTAPFVFSQRRL